MPFQFTHPWYLLAAPLVLGAAWWVGRASLARLSPGRRLAANILRAVVVLLLVFALAGFQLVHTRHSLCTVFVLDVSDSVGEDLREAGIEYIRQATGEMRKEDTAAVVVYGAEAYIELPSTEYPRLARVESVPSPNYSDLASALRLAMASFSQGSARQIVVLSDGNENLGSAMEQALSCRAGDIPIHTVALRPEIGQEVLLERGTAPSEVKQGEPFELKLVASATVPAQGVVRVFRNGEYIGEHGVELTPGKSLFGIPQAIDDSGFYTYEALLDAAPDTRSENNRALAFVQVKGRPKALILAGHPENLRPLGKALSTQEMEVAVVGMEGMPTSLATWRNWDAVAFADIPAMALVPEQMLMVQSYVRDLGAGFAMIGGEEGFGAGGYYKTPIEETLPVDMNIRKHKVFPSLAVMLVMDTSGSSGMPIDGKDMIHLEAESAIRVVETMQDNDQLGVIVSGEGVDVIAPIREARNKNKIISDLSRMEPGGGGIYCRPSMQKAYDLMRNVDARFKHIIMLADGSDCDEQNGCAEIARKMKQAKMTFSTVSFGNGPHTAFLQQVARAGGGNFYLAERADQLPKIFTKESLLAGKSLLIEEQFQPKVDPAAEILRGINLEAMPPLLGYVATTPKALADEPMKTHQNDPLLATWRYGLGRSVAWTSDAQARWAAYWLKWSDYPKFWSQALRWMMKRGQKTNWQTMVEESRGEGKITVEALDDKGEFINFLDLEARLVKPDFTTETLNLRQRAPGRYAAEFPIRDVGAYLVTVNRRDNAEESGQTAGVAIPYPPEYRDLGPNDYLLTQLTETTGGRAEPAAEAIYGGERTPARLPQDVWETLVLLAAVLWPMDIAVRRLVFEAGQLSAALARARGRVGGFLDTLRGYWPQHEAKPQQTVGQLLESRSRRRADSEQEAAAETEAAQARLGTQEEAPAVRGEIMVGLERLEEARIKTATTAREEERQTSDKDEPKEPQAAPGDPLERLRAAKKRARKGPVDGDPKKSK